MCQHATARLAGTHSSVRSARSFVSTQLATWAAVGAEVADRVDDIVLVTSELVANAVKFSSGSVELRLATHRDHVRVAVTDDSPEPARLQHPDRLASGRRGLLLVQGLSEQWGQERAPRPGARPRRPAVSIWVMPLDLGNALRAAQAADPSSIPDVVEAVAGTFGATDIVVYLVDFGQATLEPLPDRRPHADIPQSESVATTMAGRTFVSQQTTTAQRPGGARIWVPIVEGSDRTGVMALTVPEATEAVVRMSEDLALFAGHLIATQARYTDMYNLRRRRRSLSLAASMQWDLLPPLVLKTRRIAVAGLLEPAYDVGGDCFDYALNDRTFDIGIFDAMGHGTQAALVASLAVGSYRHDRREDQTLTRIHRSVDEALAQQFQASAFVTGLLARVDLDEGRMTWTNAGHPPPILIRGRAALGELHCRPTVPWGLAASTGTAGDAPTATETLEPGDGVLFYTDGVVESHGVGQEQFGVDRLVDLATQQASDRPEPEELVRHLVGSVLDHNRGDLSDDATIVLFRFHG